MRDRLEWSGRQRDMVFTVSQCPEAYGWALTNLLVDGIPLEKAKKMLRSVAQKEGL